MKTVETKVDRNLKLDSICMTFRFIAKECSHKKLFLFSVGMTIVIKGIIDIFQEYIERKIKVKSSRISQWIFLVTLWALMRSITNGMSDIVFEEQLVKFGGYFQKLLFNKLLLTDDKKYYHLSGFDIEYITSVGSKSLGKLARCVIYKPGSRLVHITLNGFLLYQITISKMSLVPIVISMVILGFLGSYMGRKISYYNHMKMRNEKKYSKLMIETIHFLPIIRNYSRIAYSLERYLGIKAEWSNIELHMKYWVSFQIFLFTLSFDILVFNFIKYNLISSNKVDVKTIFFLYKTFNSVFNTSKMIIELNDEIEEFSTSASPLIKYMYIDIEDKSKKRIVDTFRNSIEFRDVYININGKLIAASLNWTINKGEKIGIFGPNGAGKSCVLKSLMGLIVYEGCIAIDGIDIKKIRTDSYYDLFTYVPQDTFLFNATIYENLQFGNKATYDEIIEECKDLEVHDIIMKLPEGYNTSVGPEGHSINGGLRQKIFYIRALLRKSMIYMFDEPLNNLDFKKSQFLIKCINKNRYMDKTFIIICHEMKILEKIPINYKFSDGIMRRTK